MKNNDVIAQQQQQQQEQQEQEQEQQKQAAWNDLNQNYSNPKHRIAYATPSTIHRHYKGILK